MKKYSYINLIKRQAKLLSNRQQIKLTQAQNNLAKDAGFRHYHELQSVAASNPSDSRLKKAVLGANQLTEVIFESPIYDELQQILEESMSGEIADTNASNFMIDDCEVDAASYDEQTGILTITGNITYAGEQNPDQVFSGSTFYLDVEIRLFRAVDHWEFADEDELIVSSCKSDQDLDWESQYNSPSTPA